MQGLPRMHYQPRGAATYEAPLDVLIPALMRLRACDDSLKALVLVDSLPDLILPALAYAASQKNYIPKIAVQTVVRCCGPDFLARTLGAERARSLRARYAEQAVLSGL